MTPATWFVKKVLNAGGRRALKCFRNTSQKRMAWKIGRLAAREGSRRSPRSCAAILAQVPTEIPDFTNEAAARMLSPAPGSALLATRPFMRTCDRLNACRGFRYAG